MHVKETTSAMTTLHARLVAMQVLVSQLTQAHLTDDKEHEIWWFFILILVSAIFVVYFAVHAVLFANVHQHTRAAVNAVHTLEAFAHTHKHVHWAGL